MSIQALNSGTIRAISASQVLTDPTSVVKELIDNALDAHASAVYVEFSANTHDVIQVRDNGHGIAPQDRALVCKRHCTSKIRGLEDLRGIGGSSLGFRGEALASAAELAAGLTVTTRVEGEDVAVALRINRMGEVVGNDHASHPVGTTVRLTDLFQHLPVRKQTALKAVAKTLAKLKRLMQHYAFARPTVRFSLRILKAKNNNGDWVYAPKQDAALDNAAIKIVGKGCASQCAWTSHEYGGFEIEAFLPRLDADVSKINNTGQFVSVDRRPVATTRGVLKQLITKLRERLKAMSRSFEHVKDPFAWIKIRCPVESYDANVEPAKDDVVFEDAPTLLTAFEELLEQQYPKAKQGEPLSNELIGDISPMNELRSASRDRTLMDSTPVPSLDLEQPPDQICLPVSRDLTTNELIDENSQETAEACVAESSPSGTANGHCRPGASNPWTLSKHHTSTRPRPTGSARNGQLLTPLHERSSGEDNSTSATEIIDTSAVQNRAVGSVSFPPLVPWQPPSPNSSPLHNRSKIQPRARRPGAELEPDDSVSVAGAIDKVSADDDIDPSLAYLYRAPHQHSQARASSKRWRGLQSPRVNGLDSAGSTLTDEDTGLRHITSNNNRQQHQRPRGPNLDVMTDEPTTIEDEGPLWFPRSNLPLPPGSTSGASRPEVNSSNGSYKRKRGEIMDIRQAFSFGINGGSGPDSGAAERRCKPFKPVVPLQPQHKMSYDSASEVGSGVESLATGTASSSRENTAIDAAALTNESGDVGPTLFTTTLSQRPHSPQEQSRNHHTAQPEITVPVRRVPSLLMIRPADTVHNLLLTISPSLSTIATTQRTDADLDLTLASNSQRGAFAGCEAIHPRGHGEGRNQVRRSTLLEPTLSQEEKDEWMDMALLHLRSFFGVANIDASLDDTIGTEVRGVIAGSIAAALAEHAESHGQGVVV